jgi:hypothetical protein
MNDSYFSRVIDSRRNDGSCSYSPFRQQLCFNCFEWTLFFICCCYLLFRLLTFLSIFLNLILFLFVQALIQLTEQLLRRGLCRNSELITIIISEILVISRNLKLSVGVGIRFLNASVFRYVQESSPRMYKTEIQIGFYYMETGIRFGLIWT